MDGTPQVENETVKEWRERLPEVPLAVPEEEDPFRVALPRALVTGAGLAVVGAAVWTAISILLNSLDVLVDGFWVRPEEVSFSKTAVTVILTVPSLVATIFAFLAIAGWAGAKYGRLTYLRSNNSTAMRMGVVLAGSGTAAMILLLEFLARNHGLLSSSHHKGEWHEYLMLILLVMTKIIVWQVLVLVAFHLYRHRRRHCPRCCGLLTCTRELPLSVGAAEQIASAAGEVAPVNWPDLSADSTEENPERLGLSLFLYRCESCAARLLEGEISVECPERVNDWDVKWRWLSTVYSPEELATLEAAFPRHGLWERLLLRH